MLPRVSLRLRLTLWVVAIFTLIQWTTGVVFWLYQRGAIREMYEDMLLEKAPALEASVAGYMPGISHTVVNDLAREQLRWGWFGRYAMDVYHESGRLEVTGRGPVTFAEKLPLRRAMERGGPVFAWLDVDTVVSPDPGGDAAPTLVYPFTKEGERYAVVVSVSDAFALRQLALLQRVLMLAGLIGPLAAGVAGWFIAGVAVAPLERLRGFAQRLGPESIGQELKIEEEDSDVRRLSEELEEARRRIQSAFQAQGRFLSNVSHEIKTPISVLLLEAQTLPREGLSEEMREFLDNAEEEMVRLGNLVESFLTLTRVQDGKGLARELEYAANDMVMDSVDHCLTMAEQYRVRLSPRLLEGEEESETVVCGEPELLRTMLDNLVRNAIRFSPQGEAVEIGMEREDSVLVVRVRDRGAGIPPEKVDAIFDRFSQADEEQRRGRGRGHGLGLEIAQGIAELHGGKIVAVNREGGGAQFTVTLPVKPRADECEDEGAEEAAEEIAEAEGGAS